MPSGLSQAHCSNNRCNALCLSFHAPGTDNKHQTLTQTVMFVAQDESSCIQVKQTHFQAHPCVLEADGQTLTVKQNVVSTMQTAEAAPYSPAVFRHRPMRGKLRCIAVAKEAHLQQGTGPMISCNADHAVALMLGIVNLYAVITKGGSLHHLATICLGLI